MSSTMVDSNVLLDIMTEDRAWFGWSVSAIETAAECSRLVINPVIYAEISVRYSKIEELEASLPPRFFEREPIPFDAAFLAGKCFAEYRRRGGAKSSTLPDFFIGAHATLAGYSLITRDASRYSTYFPKLDLIVPGS
jgi:predicted nucleic acid-binding protein